MPRVPSSPRITSEALKLRDRRAVSISATFISTSASESCCPPAISSNSLLISFSRPSAFAHSTMLRIFGASSSLRTANNSSKLCSAASSAGASSFLNCPASMAALAFRTMSKIAACASAVFRSSSMPARIRSAVSRASSPMPGVVPAGNCPATKRN